MKPESRRLGFSAPALSLTRSVSLVSTPPISVPQFPHLHNGCGAKDREARLSALLRCHCDYLVSEESKVICFFCNRN